MNIFHIAEKVIWENALSEGIYYPEGFSKEGFIHCSELDQILGAANTFYSSRKDIVLLEIDAHLVGFPIKYESAVGSGERFPHLYGPLMIYAVVHVYAFKPDNAGEFRLPEELSGSGT